MDQRVDRDASVSNCWRRQGGPGGMRDGNRPPNLIIAGVQKAGTSSLFWYLAQHPQICVSDRKELRYFTPLRDAADAPLGPISEYAAHFANCADERYRMEATPGYVYGGRPLAAAINDTLDGVRVVLSLRDPVSRFWSAFNFVRSRMRVDKSMSFDDYLDTCEQLRAKGIDSRPEHNAYWALSGGFYADYVNDWLEVLGDRLKIVFFDDLVGDPARVTTELCSWLEIDDAVARGFNYEPENRSVFYRGSTPQRVALWINRRGELLFNRHRGVKRALKRAYYAVNAPSSRRPSLTPDARARLARIYAPSNARLAEHLRRYGYVSLPTWLPPTGVITDPDAGAGAGC